MVGAGGVTPKSVKMLVWQVGDPPKPSVKKILILSPLIASGVFQMAAKAKGMVT
jgi:hypothetical protein